MMNEQELLDIGKASLETFEPHLGTDFTLGSEESDVVLTLTLESATLFTDYRPEDQRTGRPPFCLVFACKTHMIPQGTYLIEHETLAPFAAFFSPFEAYEEGCKVEVIFN